MNFIFYGLIWKVVPDNLISPGGNLANANIMCREKSIKPWIKTVEVWEILFLYIVMVYVLLITDNVVCGDSTLPPPLTLFLLFSCMPCLVPLLPCVRYVLFSEM